MNVRTRKILVQAGIFVLAGLLLYLSLRGVDLGAVLLALEEARYRWLLPLVFIILGSHWLRAKRWQILLEALPAEARQKARGLSTTAAFSSLMIGYMANYAAPRLGEVVRSANLSARQKLPFSSVVGTVVAERVFDVLVLGLALLSVFLLLLDRTSTLQDLFIAPLLAQARQLPLGTLLALLIGAVLLFGVILWGLRSTSSPLHNLWSRHLHPLLRSFKEGVGTLLRTPKRATVIFTTIGMWFGYLLAAHIPFIMLDMLTPYGLTLLDSWAIMILGAVGVAIPSPGGAGTYHFITIQTLVLIFGVAQTDAATYAVLVHAAQMILYVVVGLAFLILQGSGWKSLRTRAAQKQEEPEFSARSKAYEPDPSSSSIKTHHAEDRH